MSQSYKKSCMFCKREIVMSERLGKWYPSDLDGGIHYCESKKATSAKEEKPQLKNLLEAQLFMQQLDARVKKLERIVVDPRK